VVDGGYFHSSIHSVDETGVSGKFKFKVAHYLRARCPIATAVVYPYLFSRTNREQALLLDSARLTLRFAFSSGAFRPAV
jgi:hypothetical protein